MSEFVHMHEVLAVEEAARAKSVKVGDTFTIAGIYGMGRNHARRWWQVWKPRWVRLSELQCFEVMHG